MLGRKIAFSTIQNVGGGVPDTPRSRQYEFAEIQSEIETPYRRGVEDAAPYSGDSDNIRAAQLSGSLYYTAG